LQPHGGDAAGKEKHNFSGACRRQAPFPQNGAEGRAAWRLAVSKTWRRSMRPDDAQCGLMTLSMIGKKLFPYEA
jgi:hypothetical protein